MSKKEYFKYVFIKTIPVFTGYTVLGIGFGILLQKAGFGVGMAALMGITIFSGTMQYVGVDLLAGGASIVTSAIVTLMVNARYLFYGLATVEKYKDAGWRRPYMIFGLVDESYAIIVSDDGPEGEDPNKFWFYVTLFDQIYWIVGDMIGVLIGSALPFSTEGVEFIMTALFITIFVDQWRDNKEHIPAVLGVGVSVVCLLIFGPDNFLIPAMIIIAAALLFLKKPIEKRGKMPLKNPVEGGDPS